MKRAAFISIVVSTLFSACASLNVREIKSMKKTYFQNMGLIPSQEHNELRIDVIRQVRETYVDGTTTYYEDVPYHPLGLDLGNGLFYDMNGNLSFRLDFLLEFDPDQPFEVNKNIRPETENNIIRYTYNDMALSITRLPQKYPKVLYHNEVFGDSTVFMRKDRFRYAIFNTDSSFCYAYRNKKPLQICKIDKNNYYTFRRKKLREFQDIDHLKLGKTFYVHLSDDKSTITVNSPWRERNNKNPLMNIQKDDNTIFIYSKNYKGRKIEFTKNGLYVTGPGFKPILYKLIEGSDSFSVQSIGYE